MLCGVIEMRWLSAGYTGITRYGQQVCVCEGGGEFVVQLRSLAKPSMWCGMIEMRWLHVSTGYTGITRYGLQTCVGGGEGSLWYN